MGLMCFSSQAKQRTQTLAKVVAAENSTSPALLPLDGPVKDGEAKEEVSTISSSSSSSEATPDHESIDAMLLAEIQALDLKLIYADKKESEVAKQVGGPSSYAKRKSEEDVSSIESKASTPSGSHPQVKDGSGGGGKKGPTVQSTLGAPWQQLLSLPPQQMLVIERMHSGARRFVVLDFGSPVLLTGECPYLVHLYLKNRYI